MNSARSIIDTIQDPAALDAYLRASSKSCTNSNDLQRNCEINTHFNSSVSSVNHPHVGNAYTPPDPKSVSHQTINLPTTLGVMHNHPITQHSMVTLNNNGHQRWPPSDMFNILARQKCSPIERTYSTINPSFVSTNSTHPSPRSVPYTTSNTGSVRSSMIKQLRFINLSDLQTQGILPIELTLEQKHLLQQLDSRIATLPSDNQQQCIGAQRELVSKYLANTLRPAAASTVNLHAPQMLSDVSPNLLKSNNKRTRPISRVDLIDQHLRQDQFYVLNPDVHRRFVTRADAIKQLTPYHLFSRSSPSDYEPTIAECQQFDELFESEAKCLSNSTERINRSIERFALLNNQLMSNAVYDKYILEKMRLDDLREQFELEKNDFQMSKRRALDDENKRLAAPLLNESTRSQPVMSDDAYYDLFNSDSESLVNGDFMGEHRDSVKLQERRQWFSEKA